jgi:hypothetical protein
VRVNDLREGEMHLSNHENAHLIETTNKADALLMQETNRRGVHPMLTGSRGGIPLMLPVDPAVAPMTPTASPRGTLPALIANALLALSRGIASRLSAPTIQITGEAAVLTVKPVSHAN